MKIAIPCSSQSLDGPVHASFGRTPYFAIYDTKNQSAVFVENNAARAVGGAGTKASQLLADHKVEALISFRLGENANRILEMTKIAIYEAKNGTIKENITWLLEGQLPILNEVHPGYHGAH